MALYPDEIKTYKGHSIRLINPKRDYWKCLVYRASETEPCSRFYEYDREKVIEDAQYWVDLEVMGADTSIQVLPTALHKWLESDD